jgi:hypothetical protein
LDQRRRSLTILAHPFEQELNGWYTDPALWPRDWSLEMLKQWCSVELHTVVVNTGESPLEDDDLKE